MGKANKPKQPQDDHAQLFLARETFKGTIKALDTEIASLHKRMAGLEAVNAKLREHMLLRDSLERAMSEEFNRQLAEKDRTIEQLKQIASRKEEAAHEATLTIQRDEELELIKQHQHSTQAIKNLQEQIILKGSTISQLEETNTKLREAIHLREAIEKAVKTEFSKQLAHKDIVIKRLSEKSTRPQTIHIDDDLHNETIILNQRVSELEEANSKLRESLMLREATEAEFREEFNRQLSEKEDTVKRLKMLRLQTETTQNDFEGINKELHAELDLTRNEAEATKQRLNQKNEEMRKLAEQSQQKEKSYESLYFQLTTQLKQKAHEIDRLKSFIAEREEITQRIEQQLQKEIAAKESQVLELKHTKDYGRTAQAERELENATQIIKVKEATARKLAMELEQQKGENQAFQRNMHAQLTYTRKLKEQYQGLLNNARRNHEKAMDSLIREHATREIATKAEAEKLKAQLTQKQLETESQKQRIDEAIKEFAIKSQQVIDLRGTDTIEALTGQSQQSQKDKERQEKERKEIDQEKEQLKEREEKVKGMLTTIEKQLKDTESKDKALEAKEQVLTRQQETLNKAIEALTAAAQPKPALSKLEQHLDIQQPTQQIPVPKRTEQPLPQPQKPILIQEAQIAPQQMKKTPINEETKYNTNEQELGYTETEEILSVIDVALQHKDTPENIKKSLLSSGYAKEAVEKAFSKLNL
ncbi:hypothetical protein HY640_01185 [Candidatus Woesearchaeota archaeon]|nr:hypothetical protein [Candidatus Woesearchaeota archaeon]